ncbi:hypothetical protein [Phenylobacterium sp.]|jgi:hypothetical protein|uniref:hypothetical protein n=1 Tax=Phenylobacterium sp. TaxID=1871053 RepID=UPI0037CBA0EB
MSDPGRRYFWGASGVEADGAAMIGAEAAGADVGAAVCPIAAVKNALAWAIRALSGAVVAGGAGGRLPGRIGFNGRPGLWLMREAQTGAEASTTG